MSVYGCLFVFLSLCLSVSLFICLFVCLPVYLSVSVYLSLCLSVYLSFSVSLCLSIYMFLCLSVYLSLSVCVSVNLSWPAQSRWHLRPCVDAYKVESFFLFSPLRKTKHSFPPLSRYVRKDDLERQRQTDGRVDG